MSDKERKIEQGPNPFDLNSIRAPQDFMVSGGIKQTTLKVAAGTRPPKDKFFRVHEFSPEYGNEEWCINATIFEHTFEGEISAESFIVLPGSEPFEKLQEKLKPVLIVFCVTLKGAKFFWELKLPTDSANRNSNSWAETRLVIAKKAQTQWVRPRADMSAGGYQMETPIAHYPDPDWDGDDFQELFKVAYRERMIRDMDHAAVKEQLGL